MRRKKCNVKRCPLIKQVEVPYAGNIKAKTILVGESPGWKEEKEGKPFVWKAGNLSREVCKAVGLNWDELFLMNSARCLIDKDKLSQKQIIGVLACCRPKVVAALKAIKPKVIIVAGAFALAQILKKKGITKAEGGWIYSKEFNCWCMPCFHPAHCLRKPADTPKLKAAFQRVVDFIKNGYKIPTEVEGDYSEIDSLREYLKAKKPLGIDTECQGLDWMDENFLCLSASVCKEPGVAHQITFYEECRVNKADFTIKWPRVVKGQRSKQIVDVGVKRAKKFKQKLFDLKTLLESPDILLYTMNGNFDIHAFRSLFRREMDCEIAIRGHALDIQTGAHLLDENQFTFANLSELQWAFTNMKSDYKRVFEVKHDKSDMIAVPKKDVIAYACADADVTYQAARTIRSKLLQSNNKKLGRYLVKFVMPALASLELLEENGAYINTEALPEVMDEVGELLDKAKEAALQVVSKKILQDEDHEGKTNLTRKEFVSDILFSKDGFKLKPVKKTKGGNAWSIDKEVRVTLLDKADLPKRARTFIEQYTTWSEYHTLYTRYLRGFEKHIKADGRIHSSLSLTTAVTGRVAGSKPSMMNNPKRSENAKLIRKLIAASPGKKLLAADASQCLVAETEIITIDGVKALADVIENKIPVLTVAGYNLSFRNVIAGWCSGVKDVYKMSLEDDSEVFCTLLHRFQTFGGDWKCLGDLEIGDKLLHVSDHSKGHYPAWTVGRKGRWAGDDRNRADLYFRKHRLVAKFTAGGFLPNDVHAHHKDGNRENWIRDNIELLPQTEHISKHTTGEKNPNYGNLSGCWKVCPVCGTDFYRPPSRCCETTCSKRCSNLYFPRKLIRERQNHKIVSIEYIGKQATYQIEVEGIHNYVLANGLCSKNSELRWLAHVAGERTMQRIFRDVSLDIHTETAKALVRKKWATLTEKEKSKARRDAKPANFGIIYGMSPWGFVKYAKAEYGIDLTMEEAIAWMRIFFGKYRGIKPYHKRAIANCKRKGYVESLLGRRRHLPDIYSEIDFLRGGAERMAINQPIQSPSSDACLMPLSEMRKDGVTNRIKPILFIHDENIFEIDENDDEKVCARIVKRYMENPPLERDFGVKFSVPFVTVVKNGPNLSDMQELKV